MNAENYAIGFNLNNTCMAGEHSMECNKKTCEQRMKDLKDNDPHNEAALQEIENCKAAVDKCLKNIKE